VERIAGESIYKELLRVRAEQTNLKRIQRLNRLFPILDKFSLEPNLYLTQNLYFEMSLEYKKRAVDEGHKEWREQFMLLGKNLGIKVE
jgi:hypothetical protein